MSEVKYVIKDKNKTPYFAVLHGLLANDLNSLENAVKAGANLNKLMIISDKSFFHYNNDEEYDDYTSYKKPILIPAIEFSEKYCSPEVHNYVSSLVKLSTEQKFHIVLKYILRSKKEISNKEMLSIINTHVNSKNVNQLIFIKGFNQPFIGDSYFKARKELKVTLLHFASFHLSVEAVEALLKLGANPNLKTSKNNETPAHLTVEQTPDKNDQSKGANILKLLLDNKANFDLVNLKSNMLVPKISVWESSVNKFKIEYLKDIFLKHQPSNLDIIEVIRKKSRKLFDFWQEQNKAFKKYPLINDIYNFEKLHIKFDDGLAHIKDSGKFFKHKSLSSAVEERYGFSSKKLNKIISSKLLARKDSVVSINGSVLAQADFLKLVYLDQPEQNISDFLDCLSNESSILIDLTNSLIRQNHRLVNPKHISSFFKVFTQQQIKQLILYKKEKNQFNIQFDDTVSMFQKYEEQMTVILKQTEFKEINDFFKLHDFISKQVKIIGNPNFQLNQEIQFKNVNKLLEVELPTDYGIKLAIENHELIKWGSDMGHCIGSNNYGERAKKGECLLVAITHKEEPKFAIEISSEGEILQVQGSSRTVPPKEVMKAFIEGMKKINLIKRGSASQWAD